MNKTYVKRYDKDRYFEAFLKNLSLRPSCYFCPAKAGRSQSDITLGDFWGIEKYDPEMDDDKGVSLILVNTEKGENILKGLNASEFKSLDYELAVASNPCITQSVHRNDSVEEFWLRYDCDGVEGVLKWLDKKRKIKLTFGNILDILKWKIHKMITR